MTDEQTGSAYLKITADIAYYLVENLPVGKSDSEYSRMNTHVRGYSKLMATKFENFGPLPLPAHQLHKIWMSLPPYVSQTKKNKNKKQITLFLYKNTLYKNN